MYKSHMSKEYILINCAGYNKGCSLARGQLSRENNISLCPARSRLR